MEDVRSIPQTIVNSIISVPMRFSSMPPMAADDIAFMTMCIRFAWNSEPDTSLYNWPRRRMFEGFSA